MQIIEKRSLHDIDDFKLGKVPRFDLEPSASPPPTTTRLRHSDA
jgi:hypothetical protein